VWNFYTDPRHFENISPVALNERLVRVSNNTLAQSTEIWISTNLFFRRTWHARIIKFEEPYEYVDKVRDRFLKKWIHRHNFANIEDKKKTAVSDEITFEIGYGPIGWIAERFVLTKLESIFRYRASRTKDLLRTY